MKRIISLLLVFALVLGLAACSGGSSGQSSSTPSSSSGSKEEAPASSADETTDSEETGGEDLSIFGTVPNKEPITFTIFIDHGWFWFDKWGSDPTSQKITEVTGVSFDVTRASDDTQLPLLIAADDLPDFVYTATGGTITELSTPERCYSYNELVDQYGVDIHATESEIQNNTASDGNYYALLNAFTSQEAIDAGETLVGPGAIGIAYRTDIYEEIGSPELNTLEDLENALIAAHEAHPEIIPLLIEGVSHVGNFRNQLGRPSSYVIYNEEGDPVYHLSDPTMKDYYALLNRFYREGLIIPEAATYSHDKFREVADSGQTFMQIRSSDEAISSNNNAIEGNTGLHWRLIDHLLNDDAYCDSVGIGWSGTFITKKNKDPQRSIEFMSWARSDEGRKLGSWGIQGEHWDYNENGETVYTDAYREQIAAGKQKQDDFGIAVWMFGDQGDENAFIDHAIVDPDQLDQQHLLEDYVKHTHVLSELYFCVPNEGDYLNIWTSITNLESSEQLKIIFAESDEEFEAAYNSLLDQAEALGLSKLNEWMKQALADHLAQ